jgi:nucleotide-binding universal stress UspA family protein
MQAMAKPPERPSFERILVALDTSRAGRSALESAALLAKAMHSELVGLFVEDSDLMALADLPFSRVVRHSGVIQDLDRDALRKEVEAHAAAARSLIRSVAVEHHLRWSFRSVRGNHRTEISAAAAQVDIVCVSGGRRGRYHRSPMENPVRLVRERNAPVLVAGQMAGRIDKPIAVIVDNADFSAESIRLAGKIAAQAQTELVVLEFLPIDSDVAAIRGGLRETIPPEVKMRTILIGRDDPCALLDTLRRSDYSVVLYGVGPDPQSPSWLDYVTDAGECPLLLVPEAGAALTSA